MNNREIGIRLGELIKNERRITNEILLLLNRAEEMRTHLELGYASLFDWLTKGFGYSNAAAYRRIEAARLLKSVPEVKEKLESGVVNLTTLRKASTAMKAEQKRSGERFSSEEKRQVLEKIENQSADEAERTLFRIFPETMLTPPHEQKVILSESLTRISLNLTNEALKDLERAKELLSHRFPEGKADEILGYVLKKFLKRTDPLQKSTSAAEATRVRRTPRVSRAAIRRSVFSKADAACTYRDPTTGKVCGSRHQVQIDHIKPRALGGTDDPENLRALCRKHNFWRAERTFGRNRMAFDRPE